MRKICLSERSAARDVSAAASSAAASSASAAAAGDASAKAPTKLTARKTGAAPEPENDDGGRQSVKRGGVGGGYYGIERGASPVRMPTPSVAVARPRNHHIRRTPRSRATRTRLATLAVRSTTTGKARGSAEKHVRNDGGCGTVSSDFSGFRGFRRALNAPSVFAGAGCSSSRKCAKARPVRAL
nr:unnamed protein product [Callosobruchus analis]